MKPSEGQIDDLLAQIARRVERKERCLITTLTKKMAEDLTDYLREAGVRVRYLHSDIDTLERVEIIRDLRLGVFDVLVGINLLREGLDLPEVSFIGILDADKEGYLRGYRSLIQTIGRAARNINGHVVMYADRRSEAMEQAIAETDRRRAVQVAHNEAHGITPLSIVKAVYQMETHRDDVSAHAAEFQESAGLPPDELLRLAKEVEREMKRAARDLEFERAAELRDRLTDLRRRIDDPEAEAAAAAAERPRAAAPPARLRPPPLRRQRRESSKSVSARVYSRVDTAQEILMVPTTPRAARRGSELRRAAERGAAAAVRHRVLDPSRPRRGRGCAAGRHAQGLAELGKPARRGRPADVAGAHLREPLHQPAQVAAPAPDRRQRRPTRPPRPTRASRAGSSTSTAATAGSPPKQRAAMFLHYHHGYSIDECADLMSCRAGSVRTHLARALASMRKEMANV